MNKLNILHVICGIGYSASGVAWIARQLPCEDHQGIMFCIISMMFCWNLIANEIDE